MEDEGEAKREEGPKVVRVPRTPTGKEREAHEATHLPHAEWCELCVRACLKQGSQTKQVAPFQERKKHQNSYEASVAGARRR